MRADAGIVISASHNPFQDNGIKFFGHDGFKLADDIEAELERLLEDGEIDTIRPTATDIGKTRQAGGRAGPLRAVREVADLDGAQARRPQARRRLRERRRLQGRAEIFAELGADVIVDRRRARRQEHQRGCGAVHPERLQPGRAEHGATSASRSTATPTG
jgi:phosphoglucosamine mutase